MPALSSTMQEGKVVSWLKGPGDKVKKGESIVVVESDKADMDVESFNDGFLGAIVVEEGGVANVGAPIAFIAETETELEEAKAKAGSAGNGAAAPPAQVGLASLCPFCSAKSANLSGCKARCGTKSGHLLSPMLLSPCPAGSSACHCHCAAD